MHCFDPKDWQPEGNGLAALLWTIVGLFAVGIIVSLLGSVQ